jgi:Flp pilus assembly protein TadB
VGDDADHHFEEHEADDQRERDRQVTSIRVRADTMRVAAVIVTVIVTVIVAVTVTVAVAAVIVVRVVVGHWAKYTAESA